jgi:hypothetical protein
LLFAETRCADGITIYPSYFMKLMLALICAAACAQSFAQDRKTENVVIVTLDGYRWREVFTGADKKILFREKYVQDTSVQSRFWAKDPLKRRKILMPFLWNVIGEQGQLYGNRQLDNGISCANKTLYSYSGYSEMLVGFHDKRVNDNDPIPNPNYTILESLNKDAAFKGKVAAFSTWETMPFILREDISKVPVNSGAEKAEGKKLTTREKKLNRMVDHEPNPHGDRFDKFTYQYAFEYMKRVKPRVMFISFDETDEHGHGGRYDEYLKSAHKADSMISHLWTWLQSQDQYKDKTTMLITTDHGRGKSPRGWKRHALLFSGSAQIWLAVIGPDTPPDGEMTNFMRLKQKQIAQTIASLLDFPYSNVKPTGEPILTVYGKDEFEEEDLASADK